MDGCDYCETKKVVLVRQEPLTHISIELGHLVMIDLFGLSDAEINFCPMCGKRLSKVEGKCQSE